MKLYLFSSTGIPNLNLGIDEEGRVVCSFSDAMLGAKTHEYSFTHEVVVVEGEISAHDGLQRALILNRLRSRTPIEVDSTPQALRTMAVAVARGEVDNEDIAMMLMSLASQHEEGHHG